VRLLALRARQDSSHWQFQRLQMSGSSSSSSKAASNGQQTCQRAALQEHKCGCWRCVRGRTHPTGSSSGCRREAAAVQHIQQQ
jgi:hypothetical protein